MERAIQPAMSCLVVTYLATTGGSSRLQHPHVIVILQRAALCTRRNLDLVDTFLHDVDTTYCNSSSKARRTPPSTTIGGGGKLRIYYSRDGYHMERRTENRRNDTALLLYDIAVPPYVSCIRRCRRIDCEVKFPDPALVPPGMVWYPCTGCFAALLL